MFAQFFIAPLMAHSSATRELNAVDRSVVWYRPSFIFQLLITADAKLSNTFILTLKHSEFSLSQQSDAARRNQLLSEIASEACSDSLL